MLLGLPKSIYYFLIPFLFLGPFTLAAVCCSGFFCGAKKLGANYGQGLEMLRDPIPKGGGGIIATKPQGLKNRLIKDCLFGFVRHTCLR